MIGLERSTNSDPRVTWEVDCCSTVRRGIPPRRPRLYIAKCLLRELIFAGGDALAHFHVHHLGLILRIC